MNARSREGIKLATDRVRHILSLSGGKDSSALAVYMRDRATWRRRLGKSSQHPIEPISFEFVFCDTQKELPETYEYLSRLESYLGTPIVRLGDKRGFDHWLDVYKGYLPSPNMRWCTRMLKIKPFEQYVGEDQVFSYIGIRADEDREGYISHKPNIKPVYPFKEDGITRNDVFRILEESGLSVPKYYEWRTRSGCYFCFFQRKAEWVGLSEHHPELFQLSKQYEKVSQETGESYTWSQGESLEELSRPERIAQIRANHEKALEQEKRIRPNRPLIDILSEALDEEDDEQACLICHL